MASIEKGILGPVNGLVGTVIGGTWKGKNYIRSKPVSSNREPSVRQLAHRAKFTLLANFLRTMRSLIAVSFKTTEMTEYNNAMKNNMHEGISGNYPDLEINYPKILVSRGDLTNATDVKAALGTGAQIAFTWTNNAGVDRATDTDKTVKVVYCPERKQTIFDYGVARRAQTDTLAVAAFAGLTVHTWFGFISEDLKMISDSMYTGSFVVPA